MMCVCVCVCKTQQKGGCPVSQKKSVWPGSQMMLETKHSIKKAMDIKSYFLVKHISYELYPLPWKTHYFFDKTDFFYL